MYKLGLIGISIAKSSAPTLHTMLGEMYNLPVSYTLHDPEENTREAFVKTLNQLREEGFRGCNVTFPFKQIAVGEVSSVNDAVKKVGATNTLRITDSAIKAANTDYTGFIRGYRGRVGDLPAGKVLLIGAGGVGRAIAFGLFDLGATEIMVYDMFEASAQSLVDTVKAAGYKASLVTQESFADAALSADGLVNGTPVGHYKSPGIPLAAELIGNQKWAFDAVYTPVDTEFLVTSHGKGLKIVSGFDLFFYQGVDAFEIFTDVEVDPLPALKRFKETFGINSQLID